MRSKLTQQVSIAVLCLASQPAMAGTIYKCVEGGTIAYHDRPCAANAVALRVQGAPAPAPEALERLARERAALRQIEDARASQEKHAQQQAREGARVQRAALAQQRRCDKLRLQRKWADEDMRRAGRDEAQQASIKARRQAEALAVECP
ncbi:MAG: DUF4124 domain-containing protein [Lysobacteraceae bacterium]|nr:MAG: DUF4124 domain-containing protein [Xanthomonadaceae bacterium]